MKRNILFLFFAFITITAFAQKIESKPQKLEKTIQDLYQKVSKTSVLIKSFDAKLGKVAGIMFSGVVVDKDGYILTAGHSVTPNMDYKVFFPDGKTYMAKGLGKITVNDASLLKITDAGEWPFAEMGDSDKLKVNQACIGISYPGPLPFNRPTLRYGYVKELMTKKGYLQTTLLMEPGDSGGPVYDMAGRVIGIHSSIELSLDENFEIPVNNFKKYWNSLIIPQKYASLPNVDSVTKFPQINTAELNIDKQQIINEYANNELIVRDYSYTIISNLNKQPISISAALIDMDKSIGLKTPKDVSYFVSKSTMVGENLTIGLENNETATAEVVLRDEENDLVLIKAFTGLKQGIFITNGPDTLSTTEIGKILISPSQSISEYYGVLSNSNISMRDQKDGAFFGVSSQMRDGKLLISSLQPSGPARRAGLKVGDEILTLDGVKLSNEDALINTVKSRKPGDKITLEISRASEKFTKVIFLHSRLDIVNHLADQFTDGKSYRRFGFKNVFVHDTRLKPEDCGGPIFDSNGNFYGINIARFTRTSSFAINKNTVLNFVKKAKDLLPS